VTFAFLGTDFVFYSITLELFQAFCTSESLARSVIASGVLYGYQVCVVIIILIIIIIITDLYSDFRSEDTEVLDAAQED